jgi:uncharacterized protein YndB with AHSA1/START domain
MPAVFAAVATVPGVAGWWTQDTRGEARAGGALRFRFHGAAGDTVEFVMEVLEQTANRRVRWRVLEGAPEWVGTELDFALDRQGDHTILLFGHRNWREPVEFMAHCSMKWATFLLSLRDFVETGTGRPAPGDMKIDNWN